VNPPRLLRLDFCPVCRRAAHAGKLAGHGAGGCAGQAVAVEYELKGGLVKSGKFRHSAFGVAGVWRDGESELVVVAPNVTALKRAAERLAAAGVET
jgi:hypothetical protein